MKTHIIGLSKFIGLDGERLIVASDVVSNNDLFGPLGAVYQYIQSAVSDHAQNVLGDRIFVADSFLELAGDTRAYVIVYEGRIFYDPDTEEPTFLASLDDKQSFVKFLKQQIKLCKRNPPTYRSSLMTTVSSRKNYVYTV